MPAKSPRQTLLRVSEDGMIVCFDGPFGTAIDLEPLRAMRPGGFVVVRSPGGNPAPAIAIADMLREKHATIVVRDYCFSACANYLFLATGKTHVTRGAIVGWHGGPQSAGDCLSSQATLSSGTARSLERWMLYCAASQPDADFYKTRGVDGRFVYQPQTAHARKMVAVATRDRRDKRSVFWMWHPDNHRDHFKMALTYEHYPESQDHVDDILRQLGIQVRVVYDPSRQLPSFAKQ